MLLKTAIKQYCMNVCNGIAIQTFNLSNLPITQTKSCFPSQVRIQTSFHRFTEIGQHLAGVTQNTLKMVFRESTPRNIPLSIPADPSTGSCLLNAHQLLGNGQHFSWIRACFPHSTLNFSSFLISRTNFHFPQRSEKLIRIPLYCSIAFK